MEKIGEPHADIIREKLLFDVLKKRHDWIDYFPNICKE